MNFVALKMLFGDRAKYLMLLAGLTFSTMLIVQQGSIFWGLMIWSQSGISNINAPVWVSGSKHQPGRRGQAIGRYSRKRGAERSWSGVGGSSVQGVAAS